jgi:hypothetical protein
MAIVHTLYGFKTAYLQRTLRLDNVAVLSTETGDFFKVGQVVNLTAKNGTTPAYISKDATPAVGDYIIAQADETIGDGHVPVEDKDYKPKGYVAVTEATAVDANSVTKSVVVYKITDIDDIVALS